jgi:hypothetical protein
MRQLFPAAFCLLAFSTCMKSPDYPIEPTIRFESLSRNFMAQGILGPDPIDSFTIVFSFTDGDGDISLPDGQDSSNIYVYDSRQPNLSQNFRVPPIPDAELGKDISGEISIKLAAPCCIFSNNTACYPNPAEPRDTFTYFIELRDRAGHFSNRIETAPIVLTCD